MQPIPGCDGYLAARDGTIVSFRSGAPRTLVPQMHKGYWHVFVRFGRGRESQRKVPVHQLVVAAFCGPKPFEEAVVRHLNGNPTDNHCGNLCWGTVAENAVDAVRHGTSAFLRSGDLHPRTRIPTAALAHIRESDLGSADLARTYGVTPAWIDSIRRGRARTVA